MNLPVKLIALDMDGTLLDSEKRLSEGNRLALEAAAAAGVQIVPTTGRFFNGLPEAVRALSFLNYAITMNGAVIYDIHSDTTLAAADIPAEKACEIIAYLETQPVIFDCYMDSWGYMTARLQAQAEDFAPNIHYLKMIQRLREPVEDLRSYVRERGKPVQKLQLFARDLETCDRIRSELLERFGDICVASSVNRNLEINDAHANKGEALTKLANTLGIPVSETMSIGDGLNDMTMIREAGIGVAMSNGRKEILEAANYITGSCDEDGVAMAIRHFLPEIPYPEVL